MNLTQPLEFEQLPREGAKAFAAFTVYLELGPQRSLAAVSHRVAKNLQLIKGWSAKYDWPARVAAYAGHMVAVERQAQEAGVRAKSAEWLQRQTDLKEREWEMHEKCIAAARRALTAFMEREKVYANLADIARILEVASKLGRMRARDVLAGEDAMKRGGEKYVPRLFGNTDDEYAAYIGRACFFNATSRTAAAYLGLVFRRSPFVKLPDASSPVGKALAEFSRDADLRGTPLTTYARDVVSEVIAVGRCGSLVDWVNDGEDRAYVSRYTAENILNWRVERINGRNLLTMVVLFEPNARNLLPGSDEFQNNSGGQIRVVRLARGSSSESRMVPLHCVVDVWQRGSSVAASATSGSSDGWQLVERHVPRRLGKALPRIPFVFHGPRNSLPDVDAVPLADVISVNLDHFRLDADFKHGMHFTALPTAWVSGFDKESTLRIGSSTAWTTDTVGATAGFLEYKGQGLRTFERAQDRDERQMAVLGARMLESSKKVGETAEAIELRQAGENSILGNPKH